MWCSQMLGNDHFDTLAERLLGRIAKQHGRGMVPRERTLTQRRSRRRNQRQPLFANVRFPDLTAVICDQESVRQGSADFVAKVFLHS
jgi:hypothetical protein